MKRGSLILHIHLALAFLCPGETLRPRRALLGRAGEAGEEVSGQLQDSAVPSGKERFQSRWEPALPPQQHGPAGVRSSLHSSPPGGDGTGAGLAL